MARNTNMTRGIIRRLRRVRTATGRISHLCQLIERAEQDAPEFAAVFRPSLAGHQAGQPDAAVDRALDDWLLAHRECLPASVRRLMRYVGIRFTTDGRALGEPTPPQR